MPHFAANLTMMYGEHAFLDRFKAAARDGFRAVEFLFPMNSMFVKSVRDSMRTVSRRLCSTPRRVIGKKASGVLPLCQDARRNSKRAFAARWNTLRFSETSGCT
jgi:hydroxypyruvate isomerase